MVNLSDAESFPVLIVFPITDPANAAALVRFKEAWFGSSHCNCIIVGFGSDLLLTRLDGDPKSRFRVPLYVAAAGLSTADGEENMDIVQCLLSLSSRLLSCSAASSSFVISAADNREKPS